MTAVVLSIKDYLRPPAARAQTESAMVIILPVIRIERYEADLWDDPKKQLFEHTITR